MTDHAIGIASLAVAVLAGIGTWAAVFQGRGEQDGGQMISLDLPQPPVPEPGLQRLAADRTTLQRIQQLLPSNGTIDYLRTHSFGNAHRGEFLEPLERFLAQTGGPEHKFLTPRLEALRQELRSDVQKFQWLVARYTFRHIQPDMYEVPAEWERDGSGRFFQAVDEMNAAAAQVTSRYDELIDTARRELLR